MARARDSTSSSGSLSAKYNQTSSREMAGGSKGSGVASGGSAARVTRGSAAAGAKGGGPATKGAAAKTKSVPARGTPRGPKTPSAVPKATAAVPKTKPSAAAGVGTKASYEVKDLAAAATEAAALADFSSRGLPALRKLCKTRKIAHTAADSATVLVVRLTLSAKAEQVAIDAAAAVAAAAAASAASTPTKGGAPAAAKAKTASGVDSAASSVPSVAVDSEGEDDDVAATDDAGDGYTLQELVADLSIKESLSILLKNDSTYTNEEVEEKVAVSVLEALQGIQRPLTIRAIANFEVTSTTKLDLPLGKPTTPFQLSQTMSGGTERCNVGRAFYQVYSRAVLRANTYATLIPDSEFMEAFDAIVDACVRSIFSERVIAQMVKDHQRAGKGKSAGGGGVGDPASAKQTFRTEIYYPAFNQAKQQFHMGLSDLAAVTIGKEGSPQLRSSFGATFPDSAMWGLDAIYACEAVGGRVLEDYKTGLGIDVAGGSTPVDMAQLGLTNAHKKKPRLTRSPTW